MTQVAAAPEDAVSLVETKLMPPRVREQIVQRPRLLRALDGYEGTELTLLSAPAGSGKSVLVGSWCAAHPELAVAWVSVDPADNDPVRLWTYVATAVDRVRPGLGRRAVERLQRSGAVVATALDELLGAIATSREPLTIVLDDLHLIQEEPALQSIEYAVEQLPRSARLIALTRADPLIRLGRLRARKALGELRVRELAFTHEEARELIVLREGVPLDDGDLGVLLERSEGWAAGLYLAALWLREQQDPKQGLQDFRGDHRHVAEYLSGEVIDGLDDDTRRFLLHTAVLTRLSGPLCDAVLDAEGSDTRLADLARSNLFLVPLDPRGEWYRYHQLFRELLRMELRRTEPATVAELHRRASAACRARGLVEEALEHADAAGDDSVVAEILLEHHRELLRTGHEATLLRWVHRVGPPALREAPELCAAGAIASGLRSRSASERAGLLRLADEAVRERPERLTPYVASALALARGAWIDGDTGRAVENARTAAEMGRRGADEIAVPALAALAFSLYVEGALAEARTIALEALDRPEAYLRPHGVVYANATLALLELELQREHAAEARAEQALELAELVGLTNSWSAALAFTAHGAAFLALGRLARGERQAERGEALRRAPEPTVEHAHALLVLAEARILRHRLAAAETDLGRAIEAIESFDDPGRLPARAARLAERLADARSSAPTLVEEPSPSELAVLRLLATELTQRQIGQQLYLSLNTVKTHARGIYRKLGASSRQEAVARAEALGLLDREDRDSA
jgi:ATP/maltotriose-dependent transcriptional regulator MalT